PSKLFFRVFIHAPHQTIHDPQAKTVHIYPREVYELVFNRVTTINLPSPFTTNCINYTNNGYESRQECIDLCRAKIINKKCNIWPQFLSAKSNVGLKQSKLCINTYKLFSTPKQCFKRCSHLDCIDEH